MKNVYFVQANNVYGTEVKNTYIPYSVGCIQAYCQKNEIISSEYRFGKFIYTREAPEKVIELLDNPFMVLFSCSVWNTEYNKTVAKAIKEAYPSCLITFGGHNVSNNENYLRDNDFIDFLTHRFGEEPTEGILESLATGKSLDEIPNISYRNEAGEIVTTAYAPQTGTDYPSPYLEGTFDEILKDDIVFSALFETNRGCPNSCSFCDWGSLKSKVRLFPMERVFAEIDWFVEHKIEFVFCTDGNFCLFNRDEEIADYIVHCKNTYGYPKMFRVCFTKNKFDFVFDIGTKFFKNGLDKAQTLSFQSMNEQVLKNVGRKNISTEKFRELMLKYNEINISTFSELILGLPGETYETFCEGVNILIENGQHYAINIYPCELLPNAEMGQKAYQEKFGIKSTRVPFKLIHSNESQKKDDIVEYSEYITSTDAMSEEEWAKSLLFASYIQGLHNLGLLRALAIYYRHEHNLSYNDFYNKLLSYSKERKGTLLNTVYERISKLCLGIISGSNELVATCEGLGDVLWGFDELIFLEFYKNLEVFYKEVKECFKGIDKNDDVVDALFKYQLDIIKKIGVEHPVISSEYDFYSYFNSIFLGGYEKLVKNKTTIAVEDGVVVKDIHEFAREIVWYGRNRRATDYTSTNYKVTKA
ncbi:MAG: radical SAM protein [Clostridia bacterium]|nr:radical SAM protein [Clostridia bacterium]